MLVTLKDVETGRFINHAPQLDVPQLIAFYRHAVRLKAVSRSMNLMHVHSRGQWSAPQNDFRETSNDRQPTGATSKPLIKRRAPSPMLLEPTPTPLHREAECETLH